MDAVFVKGFGSTAPLSALLRRKKNVFLFLSSEVAVQRVQTEPIASCSEIFTVTKIGHKTLRCSFRKRIIVQAIHSTHFLHGGEDVTANEAETYQNAIQSTTPVTQTGSQFRIGPYDGLTFLLSLMACTVSFHALSASRIFHVVTRKFITLNSPFLSGLPHRNSPFHHRDTHSARECEAP